MRFILPSQVIHEPSKRVGELLDIHSFRPDVKRDVIELYGTVDFDGTVEHLFLQELIPTEPIKVENPPEPFDISQLPRLEDFYPKKQVPTIEAKRDDEHGTERPWIGLVNGQAIRNKKGRVRTFGTEEAALAAALKEARIQWLR